MRILIYGLNHAPECTGIGKYTGEMAAWLAARGHDVRVVAAPPYYPAWEVAAGYKALRYRRERLEGVDVLRCPLWVPSRQSGRNRVMHLLSFALTSLPAVLWTGAFWRPDLLFAVEPTFFCTPGAWLAARAGAARTWLHVQDLEIDAAFEFGLLPAGPLRAVVAWGERQILGRFDHVSTISSAMRSRLDRKGLAPAMTSIFPNWVDGKQIFPDREIGLAMRREMGIEDSKIVLQYSGNMGEKQGLKILLEVAARLTAHPHVTLVLCGEGSARQLLMEVAEPLGNVRFLPLQPLERLNALLNMADVHLLPQQEAAAELVMPSKLTGMLASGKPVVATAAAGTSLANTVLQAGGCVCDPGDAEAMAALIVELATDEAKRKRGADRARAYAEAYLNKESIMQAFEQRALDLVAGRANST